MVMTEAWAAGKEGMAVARDVHQKRRSSSYIVASISRCDLVYRDFYYLCSTFIRPYGFDIECCSPEADLIDGVYRGDQR